jgi:hypothetical protein
MSRRRIDTPGSSGDNVRTMAETCKPPAVKFICGMISGEVALFGQAVEALAAALGPAEALGEVVDFDFTHYYDAQMGSPLYRRFVSFAGPHRPDFLAEAKVRTNAIEAEFAAARCGAGPARPINLDVGYVELPKLVLASMKNFSHRIYLRDGVYAEITLMFRRGRWEPLPWTFPDFRSGRYDAFLSSVRDSLPGGSDGCHGGAGPEAAL